MDLNLKNKTALITGAGRGIGKTIAKILASEGANVCLLSRTESELKTAVHEIQEEGGQASYQVFDLCKGDYQELRTKTGPVDILIHNAARPYRPKKLTHMEESDWHATINTDLNSLFQLNRMYLEDMKEKQWGRVVTIGSLSSVVGVSSYPAYCAAKSAMEGLTKNLAVDYSKYGITVNMISPGFTETERFKKAAPPQLIEKFKAATSVKRLGTGEDIANAVAFFASDKASYITGVNLLVCGGLNLGNLW